MMAGLQSRWQTGQVKWEKLAERKRRETLLYVSYEI